MRLEIVEEDFEDALSPDEVQMRLRKGTSHLGESLETTVVELMPKVIAHKLEGSLPDGFVIREIEVCAELAGKVFGCGLSGEITLRFGRK